MSETQIPCSELMSVRVILCKSFEIVRKRYLFVSAVFVYFFAMDLAITFSVISSVRGLREGSGSYSQTHSGFYFALFLVLPVLVRMIFSGAITWAAVQHLLGVNASTRDSFHAVWMQIGRIIPTSLLAGFVVFIGMLLFVLPGLYLFFMLFLTFPILMMEKLSPFRTMKRSKALMLRLQGTGLVPGLLVLLVGCCALLGELLPNPFVSVIWSAIMTNLAWIFSLVVSSALYVILKRQEELDADAISEEIT